MGPWYIATKQVTHISKKDAEKLLEQRAIHGNDHFMQGDFTYYIRCPRSLPVAPNETKTQDILTVVSGYSRGSRPHAWKGVDLKIQSTLPLLGNSQLSLDALSLDSSHKNTQIIEIRFQRDGMSKCFNSTTTNIIQKVSSSNKVNNASSSSSTKKSMNNPNKNFWDELIQPFVQQQQQAQQG